MPKTLSKIESAVFVAATLIHFMLAIVFAGQVLNLVAAGAVNILSGLVWLISSACLYLAGFRLVVGRRRSGHLLVASALGLALSAVKLGWPYPPALIAASGSLLSAVGWVLLQPWGLGQAKTANSEHQSDV